jgi:hypothetical protein
MVDTPLELVADGCLLDSAALRTTAVLALATATSTTQQDCRFSCYTAATSTRQRAALLAALEQLCHSKCLASPLLVPVDLLAA